MPAGRPSIYTDELAEQICARLMEGESLRSVCRDDAMPDLTTVCRWLANPEKHAEFCHQYALAREIQAELFADDIMGISDGSSDSDDNVRVQRDKLRVDSRKWVASRLLPKKYGDKVGHEHSGPDGGPIKTEDTSDIARKLAFLLRSSEE